MTRDQKHRAVLRRMVLWILGRWGNHACDLAVRAFGPDTSAYNDDPAVAAHEVQHFVHGYGGEDAHRAFQDHFRAQLRWANAREVDR